MLPNSILKEIFQNNIRKSTQLKEMYSLGKISFELQQDLTDAFFEKASKIKYYGQTAKIMGDLEVLQNSALEIVIHGKNSIELIAGLFVPEDDDMVDGEVDFHFDSEGDIFRIEVDSQ